MDGYYTCLLRSRGGITELLALVLLEVERDTIHTVSLIRGRLISLALEHMAEMPATARYAMSACFYRMVQTARLTSWHR